MRKPQIPSNVLLLCALMMFKSLFQAHAAESEPNPAAVAINSLAIDLLHTSCAPSENALLSPFSIQSALAMAYAGADGETRTEMAKVLHFPADEASLHRAFASLRKTLEDAMRQSEESAKNLRPRLTNDPLAIVVANRLFGQIGYDFRPVFLDLLKDTYAAPFEALDFRKDPPQAARHINAWIDAQTRHRIPNLVPETALDALTRLLLVNTLYLKAPFTEEFPKDATKPQSFYVRGKERVEVSTMNQRKEMSFAQGNGFVVVSLRLSYPLQLLVFLPAKQDGLAELEKHISADLLAGNLKWETRDVSLSLPKFKMNPPAMSLSAALQKLGLKTAFDIPPGTANFDRIAPRRAGDYLAISDVFHQTFLDVTETGIEAAAATAILYRTAGIHHPAQHVEVRVDHPFLLSITSQPRDVDNKGGTCLFVGHVTDPR